MSLPTLPTRSPPRLPVELVVQIATLVAESPQTDGLSCLAALALGSRSFADVVAPLLARTAVYYDSDRYLAWPPTTATTVEDAQVAALMGFSRCLPQARGGQEYGAGPVLLFACRTGRAGLLKELVEAAGRINKSGKWGRGRERGGETIRGSRTTRRTAGAEAEDAGTPPQTPLLSPQLYLSAHFWVPFTCVAHMPRVWQLQERASDDDENSKTNNNNIDGKTGDSSRHEMEGLLGKTTALHIAAQHGQLEVAEVILAQMKQSTSPSRNRLPCKAALDMPATLACTCPSAFMSAVAESCPDPLDWPWATPVVVALSHGHEAMARMLICAGAAWDHAPHWDGSRGISVMHVAAAQRMAGMLEWLGGLQQQCSSKTKTMMTTGQQGDGDGHQDGGPEEEEEDAVWVDWPDADGRFMLHHVCDADMDAILHSSLHSSTRGDGDPNLSRLLRTISRLGAFSRPSRRLLQAHINGARARARATAASSSLSSPLLPPWPSPSFFQSLDDMEQDQMGELAAGYMTGGDDDMLQPGAYGYAMERGLQHVAKQMEKAGLVDDGLIP